MRHLGAISVLLVVLVSATAINLLTPLSVEIKTGASEAGGIKVLEITSSTEIAIPEREGFDIIATRTLFEPDRRLRNRSEVADHHPSDMQIEDIDLIAVGSGGDGLVFLLKNSGQETPLTLREGEWIGQWRIIGGDGQSVHLMGADGPGVVLLVPDGKLLAAHGTKVD